MSKTKQIISGVRMYGKNTLVTNAFLAYAKKGESAIYESVDYVCLTRKAYVSLHHQSLTQLKEKIQEAEPIKRGKWIIHPDWISKSDVLSLIDSSLEEKE